MLLTRKEYDFIEESNRIENEPGVDFDHLAAFRLIKFFAKAGLNIHENDVLQVHKALMQNKLRKFVGEYRKTQVQIGGRLGMNPAVLHHYMDEWIEGFNKMDKDPLEYHKTFEWIHPFIDGNGRTGRLLWAYDLLRRGKEVYPMLDNYIKDNTHPEYKEALNGDYSDIRGYSGPTHLDVDNSFEGKRSRYYDLFKTT